MCSGIALLRRNQRVFEERVWDECALMSRGLCVRVRVARGCAAGVCSHVGAVPRGPGRDPRRHRGRRQPECRQEVILRRAASAVTLADAVFETLLK